MFVVLSGHHNDIIIIIILMLLVCLFVDTVNFCYKMITRYLFSVDKIHYRMKWQKGK